MRKVVLPIFDCVLAFAIVASFIEIPFALVFQLESWRWSGGIEVVICAILLYDSYRVYQHTHEETEAEATWSWLGIGLNVLAIVPMLFFLGQHPARLFRIGLLWRLVPITRLAIRLGSRRTRFTPAVFRLMAFAFWTLMIAHWMACGWIAIGPDSQLGVLDSYIRALYWTLTTLATVGYGDIVPQTSVQMLYATLVMIVGTALYGYVIGSIASLIANLDLAQAHHDKKVEQVSAFLEYRRISPDIRERILSFYEYLWESRMGFNERSILAELPPSLRTELSLYMNRNLIAKVPLFKEASEEFIRDIVIALRPVVFAPNDIIIQCGEVGEEMYFINRGSVQILGSDEDIIAELHEGQYFGEVALITDSPRNATVRSSSYCDLYRLDKRTFDHVLNRYPNVASKIQVQAKKRLTGRASQETMRKEIQKSESQRLQPQESQHHEAESLAPTNKSIGDSTDSSIDNSQNSDHEAALKSQSEPASTESSPAV